MTPLRSAVKSAFAQLEGRFRKRLELPAPSQQPLLDPGCTLLPGDLALVGAHRTDDAERILSVIALDAAPERDVLLVVQDRYWTRAQLISITTGLSPAAITRPGELTRDESARVQDAERLIAELPVELSDSIVHLGRADVVSAWLEQHPGGLAVLPAAWPASLGGDEEVAARFVRSMKTIARQSEGAIVIPWRLHAHRRLDQRPMLRDLAVSGAAEDDADLVLLFYESEYGIEIMMAKNRHGSTGYMYDSRDLGVC